MDVERGFMKNACSGVPRRKSLVGLVVDQLLQAIFDGQWQTGERLPNETQLAGQLAVSRATVREAVGVLVANGLLVRRQGSGTYVGAADHLSKAICEFSRASVCDLLELQDLVVREARRLVGSHRCQQVELHEKPDMDADTAAVSASRNKALFHLHALLHHLIQKNSALS